MPTEIRFYHLQRTGLEQALPLLLERVLDRGQRAVVMAGSPDRVEALNVHLWTYNERSFLPHGSARDGHAADQPVWLTEADERPNAADVLFLTDGATSTHLDDYALVVELFDGRSDEAVTAARGRWSAYKGAGHTLTYWRQDDRGRWSQQG
ncbi:MAG: DNA polymerase III subunit chi [Alphaproteobacteria bacterium]